LLCVVHIRFPVLGDDFSSSDYNLAH
jgi:hypothetical protein